MTVHFDDGYLQPLISLPRVSANCWSQAVTPEVRCEEDTNWFPFKVSDPNKNTPSSLQQHRQYGPHIPGQTVVLLVLFSDHGVKSQVARLFLIYDLLASSERYVSGMLLNDVCLDTFSCLPLHKPVQK